MTPHDKTTTQVSFEGWAEALQASDLDNKKQSAYKITIRWYLGFCKRCGERATIDSAKAFLKITKQEKNPNDWVYENWRQALWWFFKNAPLCDESIDTREELPDATEEWEQDLIRQLRIESKSFRTEQTYRQWCRRFVKFSLPKKAYDLGVVDLESFLSDLAVKKMVAASTQRQALNAMVYLLRGVFGQELPDLMQYRKAKIKKNLPVVLSKREIKELLEKLDGTYKLMAQLQYGAGLRVTELVRLRVKDLDFDNGYLVVRAGKGNKDRKAHLPETLVELLRKHLSRAQDLYQEDRDNDLAGVYLPEALSRKYPNAGKTWQWQWVFPSRQTSNDPRANVKRRHHVPTNPYQSKISSTARRAGISKRVTTHVLRHSYATHLLEDGTDIRTLQELLGHGSVETTMVYTHVMVKPGVRVRSPLDLLAGS